jgi:thiamine biosynthesis protein ThiS
MNIVVNGEQVTVGGDATVLDVLQALHIESTARGIAVARNGDVVLRASWEHTKLREDDRVEVLHAVQGG